MDRDAFDGLAKLLAQHQSRRAALGALLSAALLGSADAPAKQRKRRTAGRGKDYRGKAGRRGRVRAQQVPATCFSTGNCTPGPGKNLSKCNYSDSATLAGKNLKGSNLTNANLIGADATGADLRAVNLGKACLTNAGLSGAKINASTNFSTAIFCGTIMPDGSINDRDCNRPTRCCETCTPTGDPCTDDTAPCCGGGACVAGACAAPCLKDADCGPCQECAAGECQAVPDNTVDCTGAPLQPSGEFLCTTAPHTGVCVDGACSCADWDYDSSANRCRCPAGEVAACAANPPGSLQCCQISRVCADLGGSRLDCVACP